MIMQITKDEWWPVYEMDEPSGHPSERVMDVPDDLVARYKAARKEWNEVQDALYQILPGGWE